MPMPVRAISKILLNVALAAVASYQATGQVEGAVAAAVTALIALMQKPPKVTA